MKSLLIIILLVSLTGCYRPGKDEPIFSKEEERILQQQQQEFLQKKEKERLVQLENQDDEIKFNSELEEELLGDSLVAEALEANKNATQLLKENDVSDEVLEIEYNTSYDDSITKFTSNLVPFSNKEYVPSGLVSLTGSHIHDTKGNFQLRKEALIALQKMALDFHKEFEQDIYVISAYRSFKYQEKIKEGGCLDMFCARPGFSEHQSGLAIDLWDASSKEEFLAKKDYADFFEWLNENAHTYGYINTYQKGIDIDGYVEEPWHWRYVGVKFASFLKQNDFTFAEYYSFKNTIIQ